MEPFLVVGAYNYENCGNLLAMEKLAEQFLGMIQHSEASRERFWKARLVGIQGSLGTGKTTLLLQHIKKPLQII